MKHFCFMCDNFDSIIASGDNERIICSLPCIKKMNSEKKNKNATTATP